MKILIAEDEPNLLNALKIKLTIDGYHVVGCSDGRDAIKMIDIEKPDLIITDIMLPYVSGLEIVAKVKHANGVQVPVIVLSSMGLDDTVQEAFGLGADDYITKPFSLKELSIRIKRLIIAV
jgi:DNA-binding response OmpR family regulator